MIHDPLVTVKQAAMVHGVTQSTIRTWVARGLLTAELHVGRQPLYRLSAVDEAEYASRTRDKNGRTSRRDT